MRKDSKFFQNLIWTNLSSVNEINITHLEIEIEGKIYEFRDKVNLHHKLYNYHGQNCIKDSSWIMESSVLFSMALLTTIGYGHVTPVTWEGQIVCICFSMIGSPFFFICVANLSFTLGDLFRCGYTKFINFFKFKLCNFKKQINNKNDNDEVDVDFYEETDKVSVPLIVAVIVIFLYITVGSILFRSLENWTYIQASYFSFIAIATIGFGDLVPGLKDLNDNEGGKGNAERNILIAAIYLFFGIIVLAMVFDLIQEELQIQVNRARRFIIDCLENRRLEYDSEAESDEINSFMDSSNNNNEVEK